MTFYKKMENGVALVYIADCLRPTDGCLRPAQNNDTLLAAMADRGIDTNGNDIVNKNNKQRRAQMQQQTETITKIHKTRLQHMNQQTQNPTHPNTPTHTHAQKHTHTHTHTHAHDGTSTAQSTRPEAHESRGKVNLNVQ